MKETKSKKSTPKKDSTDSRFDLLLKLLEKNNDTIKTIIDLVNSFDNRLKKVENRMGLWLSKVIKELASLSYEKQVKVLSRLSIQLEPLEIDSKVYMIPTEVSDLIDNLIDQIYDLRKKHSYLKSSIGKERN